MARGPKKHMKRLAAPKHWMLDKLSGIWAPRPSTGPHKLRECIPLVVLLRNRLKYALTRREVIMIVARRLVKVDHKIRTDTNYPAGFMDIVSLDEAKEHFRLLYDVKGKFALVRVKPDSEEFKVKLCRVVKVARGGAHAHGRNPLQHGQLGAIPYITTHDGRTIRYPDPEVKVHDTVKIDILSQKILQHVKFEPGCLVMATKGNNIGRVGTLLTRERHIGSFDIVHVQDKEGHTFATRIDNVFVIGKDKPLVTLPKQKGIKLSVIEEREKKEKKAKQEAEASKAH